MNVLFSRRRRSGGRGAPLLAVLLSLAGWPGAGAAGDPAGPARPNILWITAEDMSPDLGAWGQTYARTPHLDRFAREAVRFTRAFATAPVCSPARASLITGIHATSLGTQRLRSQFPLPGWIHGFPRALRAAGYFTTNNVKTDYNTSSEPRLIRESWDENSTEAHWRHRRPGQPFFAVFNDMTTHQSRTAVWSYEEFRSRVQKELAPEEVHDPRKVPVPPYYPDTPAVRRTLARYHDCVTAMDRHAGRLLRELEEDGLAGDTIVFFFADHGAGLPRHKRLLLDSGVHVPLLVRFPPKYRALAPAGPGETVDRLVSFLDFAPTVLGLAGLPIPPSMQGIPFLGPAAGRRRAFVAAARDRVDEAYDLARALRGERYHYVRTYMPHLSYHQPSAYCDEAEIRREITRLAAAGKLSGPQLHYAAARRPLEELYDTWNDPWEIHNLAALPEYASVLACRRRRLRRWILETRDAGFLAEEDAWRRLAGRTPYEIARDPEVYPLERILAAAELVGGGPEAVPRQIELLRDGDPAVRYWAALGLGALEERRPEVRDPLQAALRDPSPAVRLEAAGALARQGEVAGALGVLTAALEDPDLDVALHAARTIELLGETARPAAAAMERAHTRAAQGEGDRHLFLRFATGAFLERIGSEPGS